MIGSPDQSKGRWRLPFLKTACPFIKQTEEAYVTRQIFTAAYHVCSVSLRADCRGALVSKPEAFTSYCVYGLKCCYADASENVRLVFCNDRAEALGITYGKLL